jgi:hypothetical protein
MICRNKAVVPIAMIGIKLRTGDLYFLSIAWLVPYLSKEFLLIKLLFRS